MAGAFFLFFFEAFWRSKAADIADELLKDRQLLAAGRRFALDQRNFHILRGILFIDAGYNALFVEMNGEDRPFEQFGLEKRNRFDFAADVVPDLFIECRDG